MFYKQIELGPLANFVYLLADPKTKECAVVDPAWDVRRILEEAKKLEVKISKVLVTHNHPDHINGIGELLKYADVPVYIHKEDAYALKGFKENLKPVVGGDSTTVGSIEISFLHTPGHTHGSQCFKVQDHLVSGDTLFIGGCGRVDLPNSDPEKMYYSLKKIASLPDQTLVFPGHNYGEEPCAKIEHEKERNPYLSASFKTGLQDFLRIVGF